MPAREKADTGYGGEALGSSLAGRFWPGSLTRSRPPSGATPPWAGGLGPDAGMLPEPPGFPHEGPAGERELRRPQNLVPERTCCLFFATFSSLDAGHRMQPTPEGKGLRPHLCVDVFNTTAGSGLRASWLQTLGRELRAPQRERLEGSESRGSWDRTGTFGATGRPPPPALAQSRERLHPQARGAGGPPSITRAVAILLHTCTALYSLQSSSPEQRQNHRALGLSSRHCGDTSLFIDKQMAQTRNAHPSPPQSRRGSP